MGVLGAAISLESEESVPLFVNLTDCCDGAVLQYLHFCVTGCRLGPGSDLFTECTPVLDAAPVRNLRYKAD